ncbi:AMP-binding protein [Kutzneria albida]|uniref:Carrier domain-containing protein n=1 Tax=Kutzneria albida DSM 43870 TaxID=1449976 RepID=W5WIM2_9PSEU|nr:AMP-binding protein [Kutzneria albida]AHI01054.1 hypothetical protein KALB_7696 [Kutzneria albida DSM 43870]
MPRAFTAAQQGIWTAQQLDPESPAFNTGEYADIAGPVDTEVFVRALRAVVGEVEALHGELGAVPVFDMSLQEAESWMAADMLRLHERDFGHALFRVGADRVLWYHRVHHLVLDGYGVSLVARRVAEVYTALVRGEDVAPARFGTLRAVLDEESAYERSEQLAVDRAFWVERSTPAVSLSEGTGLPARYFHRHWAHLSDVDTLRSVAKELGVTWPELVFAVVAAYLAGRTGAGEVVLGMPVMGRIGSASLRVPCTVLNAVPLRVRVDPGDGLAVLAGRVAAELRAVRPHLRYRYELLRRDVGLLGGRRRLFGPVVNVMPFDYGLRFDGRRATVRNLSAGPVEDLSINVYDRADGSGLLLAFDANPSRYTEEELRGHASGVLDLLSRALDGPEAPLLAAPEVLDGDPLPQVTPVLDLIAAHRHGVAIESATGDIGYPELVSRAGQVAAGLIASGVGRGSIVGVRMERGVDAIVAILGLLSAGAAYLPIDPHGPQERTALVLADASPAVVITELAPGAEEAFVRAEPEDPAYVIHTSGSTGIPNGVVVSHRALDSFVAAATERYGITSSDKVVQFAALHFDASVEEIFLTLCAGGTLVLREGTDIPELLGLCAERAVTVLDLPTAYWHELAYALSMGTVKLPETVRTVVLGGEAVLAERVERWHAAVGPSVRLINTYGPTEATVVATTADLTGPETPIGRPLAGVRASVVNGELVLSGPTVASGYLGRPELTAARFGRDGYRTGDLVRLDADGQLHHVGRADDQFKISGHRVDPGEVESALCGHPAVRQAAVVGQELPCGARRLVAHVVADHPRPTVGELRAYLAAHLPAAVVPGIVVFTASLPTTSTGKIDRAALRLEQTGTAVDGALTERERELLAVWREVLGRDDLSTTDDFFESGGQSLQTIQVANRAGVEVGLVFQYPTVAELAAHLAGGGRGFAPSSVTLEPDVLPGTERADRVLLTGATGFVGRHLLADLVARTESEIICLVRDPATICTNDRVRAVRADLAAPRLGLNDSLWREFTGRRSVIYHNGAAVNALRGYDSLRAVNVESTRSLLRMAAELHYVSTLAVTPPDCPEAFVAAHDGLRSGYQQSKWASERLAQLAAERGFPVTVYRLGRVVGETLNTADPLWRLLIAGIQLGRLPRLPLTELWIPVEQVARTIVHLSVSGRTGVVNLDGVRVDLAALPGWIRDYGYPVTEVPLDQWLREFTGDETERALFSAWAELPAAGGGAAQGDRTIVHRNLDHCVRLGLLSPPGTKPVLPATSHE